MEPKRLYCYDELSEKSRRGLTLDGKELVKKLLSEQAILEKRKGGFNAIRVKLPNGKYSNNSFVFTGDISDNWRLEDYYTETLQSAQPKNIRVEDDETESIKRDILKQFLFLESSDIAVFKLSGSTYLQITADQCRQTVYNIEKGNYSSALMSLRILKVRAVNHLKQIVNDCHDEIYLCCENVKKQAVKELKEYASGTAFRVKDTDVNLSVCVQKSDTVAINVNVSSGNLTSQVCVYTWDGYSKPTDKDVVDAIKNYIKLHDGERIFDPKEISLNHCLSLKGTSKVHAELMKIAKAPSAVLVEKKSKGTKVSVFVFRCDSYSKVHLKYSELKNIIGMNTPLEYDDSCQVTRIGKYYQTKLKASDLQIVWDTSSGDYIRLGEVTPFIKSPFSAKDIAKVLYPKTKLEMNNLATSIYTEACKNIDKISGCSSLIINIAIQQNGTIAAVITLDGESAKFNITFDKTMSANIETFNHEISTQVRDFLKHYIAEYKFNKDAPNRFANTFTALEIEILKVTVNGARCSCSAILNALDYSATSLYTKSTLLEYIRDFVNSATYKCLDGTKRSMFDQTIVRGEHCNYDAYKLRNDLAAIQWSSIAPRALDERDIPYLNRNGKEIVFSALKGTSSVTTSTLTSIRSMTRASIKDAMSVNEDNNVDYENVDNKLLLLMLGSSSKGASADKKEILRAVLDE